MVLQCKWRKDLLLRGTYLSVLLLFYSISTNINKFLSIKPYANVFVFGDFNIHHRDWLSYELINLVNSVIIFLKWSYSDDWPSYSDLWLWLSKFYSLDLFLCSDASICSEMVFSPLGNSNHVVVLVSIDFLSNSQRDPLFYCIAYDYSCVDWDSLLYHLRGVPWEDIFKLSAFAAASKFCEQVQVGIDVYIPHCKY